MASTLDMYLRELTKKLGLRDDSRSGSPDYSGISTSDSPNPTTSSPSSYLYQPEAAEQDTRERQVQAAMTSMPVKRLPAINMEPLPQPSGPGPTHEDDILSRLPGNWKFDQGVYQELNGDKAPKQMLSEDDAFDYLDFLAEGAEPGYGVTVGEPRIGPRIDMEVGEPEIDSPAVSAMRQNRRRR